MHGDILINQSENVITLFSKHFVQVSYALKSRTGKQILNNPVSRFNSIMKVILAGYPKTGIKTMSNALSLLGYKVFDFMEHFWYHGKDWNRMLIHGGSVEDFKTMYEDVDAITDAPVFFFWEQIHQAFPDALVSQSRSIPVALIAIRDAGMSVGQGGSIMLRAMETYEKQKKSLPIMLATVYQEC